MKKPRKKTITVYLIFALAACVFTLLYLLSIKGDSASARQPKPAPVHARPIKPDALGEIKDFTEANGDQVTEILDLVRTIEADKLFKLAIPFNYSSAVRKPEKWRFAPVRVEGALYTADQQRLKGMYEEFVQVELADDALNVITLLVADWPEKMKVGNVVSATGLFFMVRSYKDRNGRERMAPVIVAPKMTAIRLLPKKKRDYSNIIFISLVCLAVGLLLLSVVLRKFFETGAPETAESGPQTVQEEEQWEEEAESTDEETDFGEEDDEHIDRSW